MKQETLEVHGYRKLDGVLRAIEKRLPAIARPALGYSVEALSQRLAQKIAMIAAVPFLREGVTRHLNGSPSFPSDDGAFSAGGMTMHAETGRVRPQVKLYLRNIGEFLALWLLFVGAWAVSLWRGRANPPALLLFGVPVDQLTFDGNDARFVDFCRRGPLEVLRRSKKIVVHTPHTISPTRPDEVTYTRFPLLSLFSSRRKGVRGSLFFIGAHMRALILFFAAVVRAPIHCILWRDFAEHAAAAALNREHAIDAIVITNSNWLQQLMWMNALQGRRFAIHMALYSLNNHAIVYRGDPVSHPYPGIRHLKVDEVWVWNEPYRERLSADGVSAPSVVVDPILWCLPERADTGRSGGEITLCVFDVQPRTTEWARASGSLSSYYNLDTAKRFIDDIILMRDRVAARTGIDMRIVLKHKRPPTWQHDRQYFDHIDRLVASARRFAVTPADSNVYGLIADSRLVIAPPYSSPAYVAAHVGVPAIFYDPTGQVLPTHAPHPLIRFADGQEALEAVITELANRDTPATVRS